MSVNEAYKEARKKLEIIYDFINTTLFNCSLPDDVLITIEPEKSESKLGWFCSRSYWTYCGERVRQINIVPQHMNRAFIDICETMLHECVHLFCDIQNERTTNYHNISFKKAAEDHGLNVDKSNNGWSLTELKPETKALFENFLKSHDFAESPSIYCSTPPKFITIEADPIARYRCRDCELVIQVVIQDPSSVAPTINCPLCKKQMTVILPRKKKDS